ncbi:MAG: hypothetical protein QXG46_04015 [Ignisphaera sp.]
MCGEVDGTPSLLMSVSEHNTIMDGEIDVENRINKLYVKSGGGF